MESTAFEMLLLPMILAIVGTIFACSLVSLLVDWAGRLVTACFRWSTEVDHAPDYRQATRESDWRWHHADDPRSVAPKGEIDRRHRGRLAG